MAKRIPPSILQGILSLLGSKIPRWLTNLIGKTKGGEEYLQSFIKDVDIMQKQTSDLTKKHPFLTEDKEFMELEKLKQQEIKKLKEYSDINKPAADLMSRWLRETDVVKKENEKLLQETVDKLKDSKKIATSMEEEVKNMIDKVEDLNQKIKLLNPDDDDPTYHSTGGIASLAKGGGFHKGLWEALMRLGKHFHKDPRDMLKSFIELGLPISDKLKQKWGIADADLEFKKPTEKTPTQEELFTDETMDLFDKFETIDDLKFQKLKNNLKKIKEDNQAMEDAGYRFDDESDEWVKADTPYDKALKEQTATIIDLPIKFKKRQDTISGKTKYPMVDPDDPNWILLEAKGPGGTRTGRTQFEVLPWNNPEKPMERRYKIWDLWDDDKNTWREKPEFVKIVDEKYKTIMESVPEKYKGGLVSLVI